MGAGVGNKGWDLASQKRYQGMGILDVIMMDIYGFGTDIWAMERIYGMGKAMGPFFCI